MKKKRDQFEGERIVVLPSAITERLNSKSFTSKLYVTDIGYYPTAVNHYVNRPTGCMENIIVFCQSGHGTVYCQNQSAILTADQYVMLPAGKAHWYAADGTKPWSIFWMHFTGTDAAMFAPEQETFRSSATNPELSQIRQNLFNQVITLLEGGYSDETLEYSCILLQQLLGSFKYASAFERMNTTTPVTNPIDQSIEFMKANLRNRLYLHQLAVQCGYSVSHYGKLFRQKTTEAPLDYLNILRIQKACSLLELSRLKVKEIAHAVGFEDAYYFMRVFRKIMGVTPTQHRRLGQAAGK